MAKKGGWAAIKKKAKESTTTKNAAQCKMKYLSNVSIIDGSWQVTNKDFLDHWQDTCWVCEEYTLFTHLDDELKLEMLKNAVKGALILLVWKPTQIFTNKWATL
jgi:hypothetical protein